MREGAMCWNGNRAGRGQRREWVRYGFRFPLGEKVYPERKKEHSQSEMVLATQHFFTQKPSNHTTRSELSRELILVLQACFVFRQMQAKECWNSQQSQPFRFLFQLVEDWHQNCSTVSET